IQKKATALPGTMPPEISAKDERTKMGKRQSIERYWRCPLQEALPAQIRPRLAQLRGPKPRIGSTVPEAPWMKWSVKLLTELERLSSITSGKLVFAQELMTLEVKQRQQDWLNRYKDALELDNDDDDDDDGDDDDDDDDDDDGAEAEDENECRERDGNDGLEKPRIDDDEGKNEAKIKDEPADDDVEMIEDLPNARAVRVQQESKDEHTVAAVQYHSHSQPLGTGTVSKDILKARARIATLRADAMRLKQEAARRKAEAYELEAKMLKQEAKLFN
ncbi:hypothetical protein LTR37_004976, partial [Vermiconidia calcicola]